MEQYKKSAMPLQKMLARYYADVPNRFIALLVDVVLLTVVIFFAAIVVSVLLGPAVEFNSRAGTLEGTVTVDRSVATVNASLSLILSAAFFVGSWVNLGASPGQWVFGMRVGHEGDGTTLELLQALTRWGMMAAPFGVVALLTVVLPVLRTPSTLLLVAWYAVLLITTARSSTKQGLHDRLAHSVVSKSANPVAWNQEGSNVH